MSYIDHADYKQMLNRLGKGTPKGVLKENYIDLTPINNLWEDESITNPGEYKKKSYDLDGDGVPNGADKAPTDGAKHEGIHLDKVTGPTESMKSGRDFSKLSVDEREQLKQYINSIKEIKGAIQELMAKATMAEGGDTTGLVMTPEGDKEGMSDEEAEDLIAKHEKEKEGEEAVKGQYDM